MPKPRRIAVNLDLAWPYKRHASTFAGTQKFAQEQGWETIVDEFVEDSVARPRNKAARYDGIIARATTSLAEHAKRRRVPVVNVWLSSPAIDLLPGVFVDFPAVGRLRAEHLLSRGFRNFAALGCRNDQAHTLEVAAFRRVLRDAGHGCTTTRIPLTYSKTLANWRKTEEALTAWMDGWQLPIGVYVGPDNVGRIVVQICKERGWRVPEDVAVVAGWNEETICENPRPSLTSVELGHERVGYEAARMLGRLMNGKKLKKGEERILLPPLALVVRESTDFYAVDDALVAAALEFISAHSNKAIGPDAVAKAVATETRTLQRRFRAVLDRPIATEIRRVRIERAKRELSQTDRPMATIARDVGFGPAMRMYEIFCRELGVSPSQYRKQRQMQINL